MEVWRDVFNYEGMYQVSNMGNIRSLDRMINNRKYAGRELKQYTNSNGYNICTLCKEGVYKKFLVHRLVAEAFIPNLDNKPQVNHIIEISKGGTNEASNLEWVTAKENINKKSPESLESKHKKEVFVYNKQTSQLVYRFDSLTECSEKLGLPLSNISAVTKGKRGSCGGYIFTLTDSRRKQI